jgi:hypothetical protein
MEELRAKLEVYELKIRNYEDKLTMSQDSDTLVKSLKSKLYVFYF